MYPNNVGLQNFFPVHIDTVKDGFKRSSGLYAPKYSRNLNTKTAFVKERLPRGCERFLGYFKRCKMVNGAENCGKELQEMMELCPTFALESSLC
jgi:hypothetical protein